MGQSGVRLENFSDLVPDSQTGLDNNWQSNDNLWADLEPVLHPGLYCQITGGINSNGEE